MKNVFSFFLLFVASSAVFGQIEWVGNHDFSESGADILHTSQNQYILVHGNGTGLTVFDSNGVVIFQKSLMDGYVNNYTQISDIIELPDLSVVFTAGIVDCDVFIERFYKFDKYWNESPPTFSTLNARYTGPAARFSDNTLVFATGPGGWASENSLSKLDMEGTEVWGIELDGFSIRDLVITPSDTILVATTAGLVKLTSDGEIVSTNPSLVFERLEILPNGNYLAQSSNLLNIYSPEFTVLSSFGVQSDSITDIDFTSNEIAVLTSTPAVLRLGDSLSLLSTTPLVGENQAFTALAFKNDGFFVGGLEGYGTQEHGNKASFLKEFNLNGSTLNTDTDIAINEVTFTSDGSAYLVDWDMNYGVRFSDLLLTVENKGNSTINELTLNLEIPYYDAWSFACDNISFFQKTFTNLNLLAGTTTQLDWGYQLVRFGQDPSGMQVDLCFWTSLPNNHLDTNHQNDVSCTMPLTVVVDTKETMDGKLSVHHFNAITDELYLNLPPGIDPEKTTIAVFNTAAQLVASQKLLGDEPISLRPLPDGMYLLRASSNGRVGWVKVVKY
ncbi:MAG: T9SS type A sorting domain-containing protein [Saprospiraceae bacterium]|jgi:hypothetical protein|nr:T9SS type A sorting domain-containing protein [Saprospiraceae bacterium]